MERKISAMDRLELQYTNFEDAHMMKRIIDRFREKYGIPRSASDVGIDLNRGVIEWD